jgi:Mor family transcriptional regulator
MELDKSKRLRRKLIIANYKNGRDILPPDLLKELQQYIQGELIYIPKKNNQRVGWGELSGTRKLITRRNEEIYHLYTEGSSVEDLQQAYYLSEDSIRKVIVKMRIELSKSSVKS